MIDTDDLDNMSRRDLVELLEAYNESLAEVERLREGIKQIARDYDFIAIKSQSRHCARPAYDVPAGDGIHTVTFHQKACLKIMELIE
tara:strand:- start:8965 stop:9225 length:261 start_codon:yes stop_codon:yes gene_type:complete